MIGLKGSLALPLVLLSAVAAADDVVPPGEVLNLVVDKAGDDAVLTWDPLASDLLGNPETVGYRLFRGTAADFLPDRLAGSNAIANPAAETHSDAGALTAAQSFFYLVAAVDAAGNLGNTRPSDALAVPTLGVSFSTTAAELNWGTAGAGVAGYRVLWGPASGDYQHSKDVGALNGDSVFPLIGGQDYFFAVLPYDAEGNFGPISNEVTGRLLTAGLGTEVCGRIDSATTWALVDSPFIVTCNIEVWDDSSPFERGPGGASLTIEPGVVVRFEPGTGMTVGSSNADVGTLFASGTPTQPIVFTANKTFPARGDWEGLRFNAGADDGSTLQYLAIEYGGSGTDGAGLTLADASPLISHVTVRESANYGIDIEAAGAPHLDSVTVSGTDDFGIFVGGAADPIITDALIQDVADGFQGIRFSTNTNAIIQDSDIDHGLFFGSVVGSPTLSGNTFRRYDGAPSRVSAADLGTLLETTTILGAAPTSRLEFLAERVSQDATWTNLGFPLVAVSGDTVVAGTEIDPAVLTLEAGLEIRFRAGTRLEMGSGIDRGALVAVGTVTEPIVFTSDSAVPAPGQWEGLSFRDGTDDALSVLEHVVVEYAGATLNSNVYLDRASPTIRNATIRHSSQYGVRGDAAPSSPQVRDSLFVGNADYDVYLEGVTTAAIEGNSFSTAVFVETDSPGYTLRHNTFNNYDGSFNLRVGGQELIRLQTNSFNGQTAASEIEVLGGFVGEDGTWPNLGMPYRMVGNITIAGTADTAAEITIAPGTQWRFNANLGLFIGNSTLRGRLIAVGTEAQPIVFTTSNPNPAPGQWRSIFFNVATESGTILQDCVIEYGGAFDIANVRLIGSSPTIRDCEIRNGSRYGVYGTLFNGEIASPTLVDNNFSGQGDHDVRITDGSDAVITGNSFTQAVRFDDPEGQPVVQNNVFNDYAASGQLSVPADSVAGLTGNIFNGADATSVIEVEAEVLSADAQWANLGLPYDIVGDLYVYRDTAQAATLTLDPGVTLRFQSGRALFIGSDTNQGALVAVGTELDPITFTADSAAPGPGAWETIYFDNAAVDATSRLEHCVVEYGGQAFATGIRLVAASPTISNCQVRSNSGYGIYGTGFSSPTIEASTFTGNFNLDVFFDGGSHATLDGNTFNRGARFDDEFGNLTVRNNVFNNYVEPNLLRIPADRVTQLVGNVFNDTDARSAVELRGDHGGRGQLLGEANRPLSIGGGQHLCRWDVQ